MKYGSWIRSYHRLETHRKCMRDLTDSPDSISVINPNDIYEFTVETVAVSIRDWIF